MTPRVVRTVEELRDGMVVRDSSGDVAEVVFGVDGVNRVYPTQDEPNIAVNWIHFPATVLAPLSVTSEQVEAGVRASFVGGSRLAAEAWDAYPEDHPVKRYERRRFVVALAALGIEVVDGE